MPLSRAITDKTLATPEGETAYEIVERLADAGYDTWWVGGCVRDMLLGHTPYDIDIATDAFPNVVTKLFPRSDERGREFGSIFVHAGGAVFHVTTFREDDEASDGRHPESVVFGRRELDAKRRDFTINALYWHPISGELYDPFNGEKDLQERLIRFIGDPATKIKHDALRLMRAVRFRARLDGQYEPETYKALREQAHLIEIISGTRIYEELGKMLLGPHPDRALEDLWELGILQYIILELYDCKGVPQPAEYHHEGDVWEHILRCARSFREEHGIDVRLAAIFHDIGKVKTYSLKERIRFDGHASLSAELTSGILDRLKCGNRRKEKIVWLVRHHMMVPSFLEMQEGRKGHWYHHPWFTELLQLFELDIAGTDPADESLYKKIIQDYEHFLDSHPAPPKQLLTGNDVMEVLGLEAGKRVGEILQQMYELQLDGKITTKKEAKEHLKKLRN